MYRSKNILTAVALALCLYLFGIVQSSHGFEVTSMTVENGASGCYVTLTADEDIDFIGWWLKENDNDYKLVHTSRHDPGTRSVCVNIGWLAGSPYGKKYSIAARLWRRLVDVDWPLAFAVCRSDIHHVYVYSEPVTETKYGNWSLATLYGEVDVGWNGTTAEAMAYGTITNAPNKDIVYGIRIEYQVGRKTKRGQLAATLDSSGFLFEQGRIKADTADNFKYNYYSTSYALGAGAHKGFRYFVEAQVAVTAQVVGGNPNNIEELRVSEYEELYIPKD